ncbi:MAG: hypothetical protein BWY29_00627 [Microgenomates group bacterium ADurb.Bin238]|nr:MAG: hypothetical protein BWY29_00627 [Microgenomates group bacterium ADurb.Bin238]
MEYGKNKVRKILGLCGFLAVFGWAGIVQADWSVWDEPVVYYDFESVQGDGTTLIKDRVGFNDLTLTTTGSGATGTGSRGKYGRKAEFDGVDDYGIALDTAVFSQTGSFSVEAWVKFDTVSAFSVPDVDWLPLGTGGPRAAVMRQIHDLILTL